MPVEEQVSVTEFQLPSFSLTPIGSCLGSSELFLDDTVLKRTTSRVKCRVPRGFWLFIFFPPSFGLRTKNLKHCYEALHKNCLRPVAGRHFVVGFFFLALSFSDQVPLDVINWKGLNSAVVPRKNVGIQLVSNDLEVRALQ